MLELTLDNEHIYRLDGVRIPGVTEVLQSAGLIDAHWFTERAKLRGLGFHQAAHYLDEGDLDPKSVDHALQPYLQAYERFKAETDFRAVGIEIQDYHLVYRYAGTIDRIGGTGVGGKAIVIDFKTGSPAAWHRLQLAAYAEIVGAHERWNLYLSGDGRYKLRIHPVSERRADFAVFLAALSIHNFKEGKWTEKKS